MARARNIKPGILKNELLGTADGLYTILFAGLWMLADREGRLEDRPLRIKAEVFPYRDVDINAQLDWLAANGFIERYESKGQKCIAIGKFLDHQRPHQNEPESTLPPPPGAPRARRAPSNGASTSTNGKSASLLLIESLLTESPSPLGEASPALRDALVRWARHRTEKRTPLTETSLRQQVEKIVRWGEARAIAAINFSIAQGYTGMFEEKGPKASQSGPAADRAASMIRQAAAAAHQPESPHE